MAAFEHLFSPLQIGAKTVKNRIVSAPHVPRLDERGRLSERHIRYHVRKAEGGVGLVMTFGSANVHPTAARLAIAINLWDAANEEPLRDFARRVHEHDCLIVSQASHVGRRASALEPGTYVQGVSAARELVHSEVPHVLRAAEIEEIVRSFAAAARRLERAGWDGIEITSFGGHLIEQFWSPVVNTRKDRYGGDLEGRTRFAVEVIQAVGEAVSDDFIVGFRMSADASDEEVGLSPDDMLEIAARLDAVARVDLFSISGSTGASRDAQVGTVPIDSQPVGTYLELAHAMKERLSVPVLCAGRILDAMQGEEALAHGGCDLVAMTRAIIADPDLPRRAQAGEAERIRPCIAINQDCIGRIAYNGRLQCAVNPEIGHEDDVAAFTGLPAPPVRRLAVVGGGPAGMEAARVAAERGHDVVLFERTGVLGGQVVTAARAPDRPNLGRHIGWLAGELSRLAVDVRLDTKASADSVLGESPDAVVVATGSASVVPDGVATRAQTATDVALFDEGVRVDGGSRVLVWDTEGGIRAVGAALVAAAGGASSVDLASAHLEVCEKIDAWQKPLALRGLFDAGIACTTNERLVRDGGRSLLRHRWSREERALDDFDLVVFVGYHIARDALGVELLDRLGDERVRLIGDCLAPRRIQDAVFEGVRAGYETGVKLAAGVGEAVGAGRD